jgi:hypothetical protein
LLTLALVNDLPGRLRLETGSTMMLSDGSAAEAEAGVAADDF